MSSAFAYAVAPLQMGPGVWGGWWVGILGMVVWALVLAAVVYAVVRLVILPVVEGADARAGPEDDALAELRQRFARGEIDEEEFERRAEVLRRPRGEE